MTKEKIRLSDHFTFSKILRFTIGPILMMFFTSIYWIMDGIWLSIIVAEILSMAMTIIIMIMKKGKYGYLVFHRLRR